MTRVMLKAVLLVVALMLGGCGPEDGRAVGGGLGADIGNHDPNVPKSKIFVPGETGTPDAEH